MTLLRLIPISPTSFFQLLLLLSCLTQWASAANLTKEQRISEELEATLSEGSPIWLETGSVRFLGIFKRTSAPKRLGATVLLHDSGAHANWHEVISPLRRYLTERGWDTLSIQTPISDDPSDPLSEKGLLSSSLPRIQAAVEFHTERDIDGVILIGHGLGAKMMMSFVTQTPNEIKAMVAIGVAMNPDDDQDPVSRAIKGAEIPILDLYGSQDHESVVVSAPLRRVIALRNNRDLYRLVEVAGADHFFTGIQEELSHRVAAWLKQALFR
jgi:pimeloyl-ACP methyl ester carboxylesterase